MNSKQKQDKIDLIVKELNEKIPIIFDPYKNPVDCMQLWNKFALGKWASINSYAVSNDWSAKVVNSKGQPEFKVVAEGNSMIEAMTECMYLFFSNEHQYNK